MFTEQLFFYPDSYNYGGLPPVNESESFEHIYIEEFNADVRLYGWFAKPLKVIPKATIIHFHGNAANISNHWNQVSWIPSQGYNLFTFDYRGFGESTGKTTFSGIHQDCLSAISYAREKLDNTGKLILLGQSLGGAFCLSATAKDRGKDIKGIILDSCFDSFINIAIAKISIIPSPVASFAANFLVSDQYSPIESIKSLNSLKIPKLFIHGELDRVVPFDQGYNLFRLASEPKKFLPIKYQDHISIFIDKTPENMSIVLGFLEDCLV